MKKLLSVLAIAALAMPATAQPVYHMSARDLTGIGNQVWVFDGAGNWTGNQYTQVNGAENDAWGYRDGASDGTNVYFGWGGGLNIHDGATGAPVGQMIVGGGPNGTWRALAYNPDGDNGNGSLWSASFSTDLLEVDMNGNIINTMVNTFGWSLYGVAWNNDDGTMWGHTTGGEVIKIDTVGNTVSPGWLNGFPMLAAQGGLSSLDDGSGDVCAVSQGTPDEYGVYDEATGNLVGGPWDMEGQTGSNGHLGVAVHAGGGGGGFTLAFEGTCNDTVLVVITGGKARARCAFAFGTDPGSLGPVPGCPDLFVDIKGAQQWKPGDPLFINLDENGEFLFKKAGGPNLCGKLVQVIDLTNCAKTNVEVIPG